MKFERCSSHEETRHIAFPLYESHIHSQKCKETGDFLNTIYFA